MYFCLLATLKAYSCTPRVGHACKARRPTFDEQTLLGTSTVSRNGGFNCADRSYTVFISKERLYGAEKALNHPIQPKNSAVQSRLFRMG